MPIAARHHEVPGLTICRISPKMADPENGALIEGFLRAAVAY
jgi:hypothetical protein